MIDYEKEFGKPEYAAGARQVQIAATFKIVYGWMCAGLAGREAWHGRGCGLIFNNVAAFVATLLTGRSALW